ncbi:hypothetical protein V2W45_1326435 [Cenococcum geophilum]
MYSPVSRSDTVSTNSSRNSSMLKCGNPRRKVTNYKTQAEKSQQPPKLLRQDSYPTYRLKWEKLKAFLERKFPDHTFKERRVIGDKYIFNIPESLKSHFHDQVLLTKWLYKADRDEIANERDEDPNEQPRRADSPELY